MPVLHRRLEAPLSDSLGRLFVQSHTNPANNVDEIDGAPLTDADEQVDRHFFLVFFLSASALASGLRSGGVVLIASGAETGLPT